MKLIFLKYLSSSASKAPNEFLEVPLNHLDRSS